MTENTSPTNNPTDNSITRARGLAKTGAEVVVKVVLSSVGVPSTALDLIKGLAMTTKQAIVDRQTEDIAIRIGNFLSDLKTGGERKLTRDQLDRLIHDDPGRAMSSLMRQVAEDDESGKSAYYARFYRALVKAHEDNRSIKVSRWLKKLRAFDVPTIDFLHEATLVQLSPTQDADQFMIEAFRDRRHEVQSLLNAGFVSEKHRPQGKAHSYGSPRHFVNPRGSSYIKFLYFDDRQLEAAPEAPSASL